MTATERLDAIDARTAAATEPPWVARRHGDHQYVSAARTSVAEVGSLFDDGGDGEVLADAEFIAHARQDIPDLTAAIRDVLALHVRLTDVHLAGRPLGHDICQACGLLPWPCATVAAIAARLGDA